MCVVWESPCLCEPKIVACFNYCFLQLNFSPQISLDRAGLMMITLLAQLALLGFAFCIPGLIIAEKGLGEVLQGAVL